ncbi:MAG: hypothetical protein RRC34_07705 [Lentisphaeria bacterium]|nr:hypothetical protein [Lentisphaeria bacterium]
MNKSHSRTRYAAMNMATNVVGYFFNTLLGFVCRIVFVHYLTVDYLGVNGLFTSIIAMLSLTELGIGSVITYSLYEPLARGDRKRIAVLMTFYAGIYKVIGLIVAGMGLALIPFLNKIISEPPDIKEDLALIYLFFLFNSVFSYFFSHKISLLRAAQKDYIVVGASYLITTLQSLFQIAVLIVTKNYLYYLYIQTFGTICYFFWLSLVVKKHYGFIPVDPVDTLDKAEKKKLFKDVWALSVAKLSGVLVNSTDSLIISNLINVAAVGLLSNYLLLANTLNSLISKLLISLKAGIGNFNAVEKKENTQRLFFHIHFLLFAFYGCGTVGILIVANDLIKLLFGEEYLIPANVVAVLALNFYMVGMQNVVGTFKESLGLFKYGRYVLLLTAFINLFLSFLLGKKLGLFGILLATAIARFLTNWWYFPIIVFKRGFNGNPIKYYLTYALQGVFLLCAAGLSALACGHVSLSPLLNVFTKSVICVSIFYISLFLVFHRRAEFVYFGHKARHGFLKMTQSTNAENEK